MNTANPTRYEVIDTTTGQCVAMRAVCSRPNLRGYAKANAKAASAADSAAARLNRKDAGRYVVRTVTA